MDLQRVSDGDTHFSYVNLQLKRFVEDGNDIQEPVDIFHAFEFGGGIANTTALLLEEV